MASITMTACALLDKLLTEFRLEIYELLLTCSVQGDEIDLLNCEPPDKAILQTCRQIYHEAASIYLEAYRRFWQTSKFVLTQQADKPITMELTTIPSELDLEHVGHMRLLRPDSNEPPVLYTFTLIDREGLWKAQGSTGPSICMRVDLSLGTVVHAHGHASREATWDALAKFMGRPSVKDQLQHFMHL